MKNRILQVLLLLLMTSSCLFIGEKALSSNADKENVSLKNLPTLNISAGVNAAIQDTEVAETETENEVEVQTQEVQTQIGYLTTNVNVRQEPNTDSSILEVFKFNQEVEYVDFNEEWVQIKYRDDIAYLYKTYISETVNTYRVFPVPRTSGFKSFEPYNRFNPKYNQYKLQQYAYSDENGLRVVDGRYCIALGTYYFENLTNDVIGTYVDLVLENGEVIPCILGDIKADEHTDANNIITTANGCLSEFICDKSKLPKDVKTMGDVSYIKSEWNSPVEKIIIYEKNFFYKEG